jgi:hypothetical protein
MEREQEEAQQRTNDTGGRQKCAEVRGTTGRIREKAASCRKEQGNEGKKTGRLERTTAMDWIEDRYPLSRLEWSLHSLRIFKETRQVTSGAVVTRPGLSFWSCYATRERTAFNRGSRGMDG